MNISDRLIGNFDVSSIIDEKIFYDVTEAWWDIRRIVSFRTAGTTAEPDHVKVHRALPRGGVIVAEEAEYRRSSDDGMVRGAAHLDAPREHFHVVRGHTTTIAGRRGEVRSHRQGVQGDDGGDGEDAERHRSDEQGRPCFRFGRSAKGARAMRESPSRISRNQAPRLPAILLCLLQRSAGRTFERQSTGSSSETPDEAVRFHGATEVRRWEHPKARLW